MRAIEEIVQTIQRGGRLTVLTGAGISAESGLRTFRDAGGLWEGHSLEEVATPQGFRSNPELVHRFYNTRRGHLLAVKPNAAHRALAGLEEKLGGRFTLITQNVDDLHERAGARRVLHMHGEILKARCERCSEVLAWLTDLSTGDLCGQCGGALRPHVVWFGELPFFMESEIPAALEAEVFVSIGTSGVVYPAAGFVAQARRHGALTVEINLEPSASAHFFDVAIIGRATEKVPEFARAVLG